MYLAIDRTKWQSNNILMVSTIWRKRAIPIPIDGFNLAGKWLRKYRNITPKELWYILTSLADLQAAVDAYAKRFGIEERRALAFVPRRFSAIRQMFRDFKDGGYNLEKTNLTSNRGSPRLVMTNQY